MYNFIFRIHLLRVELEFPDDDELASWPWEYLYRPKDKTLDSDNFLVQITQLVLNRWLSLEDASLIRLGTPKPVKVLLIVAKPLGEGKIIADMVVEKLQELHNSGVIKQEVLIDDLDEEDPCPPNSASLKATRDKFAEAVEKFKPNIIHFIGHGQSQGKHGAVAFVGENGRARPVIDTDFAGLATQCKDHLKLVFLQACESAHSDPLQ